MTADEKLYLVVVLHDVGRIESAAGRETLSFSTYRQRNSAISIGTEFSCGTRMFVVHFFEIPRRAFITVAGSAYITRLAGIVLKMLPSVLKIHFAGLLQ